MRSFHFTLTATTEKATTLQKSQIFISTPSTTEKEIAP